MRVLRKRKREQVRRKNYESIEKKKGREGKKKNEEWIKKKE